jgi:hypothetical protein
MVTKMTPINQVLADLKYSKNICHCVTLFSLLIEKMSVLEKQVEQHQKTLDFILEKILEDECDAMFTPVAEAVEIPCVASYMFNSDVD